MTEKGAGADKRPGGRIVWAVVAAVIVLALIIAFLVLPVRRPRPTINGAPAETTNLSGGPVNGVGDSLAGNTTGDR